MNITKKLRAMDIKIGIFTLITLFANWGCFDETDRKDETFQYENVGKNILPEISALTRTSADEQALYEQSISKKVTPFQDLRLMYEGASSFQSIKDSHSQKILRDIKWYSGGITFSPKKTYVLSYIDGLFCLLDSQSGKLLKALSGKISEVNESDDMVIFSSDERYLAFVKSGRIGEKNAEIAIWKTIDGELASTFLCENIEGIEFASFSPDNQHFTVQGVFWLDGRPDEEMELLEVEAGKRIGVFTTPVADRYSDLPPIQFSPSGSYFMIRGTGTLRETGTGRTAWESAWDLRNFSPNERYTLAFDRDSTVFHLLETETGQDIRQLSFLDCWPSQFESNFSHDGRYLQCHSYDVADYSNCLTVWEVASGELLWTTSREEEFQEIVLKTEIPERIRYDDIFWDTVEEHTTKMQDNYHHVVRIGSLAFSPNGVYMARTYSGSSIRLWNLISGTVQIIKGHSEPILSMKFSANGRYLMSIDSQGIIGIWGLNDGQQIEILSTNESLKYAAFSDDGNYVATLDSLGILEYWEVFTGKEIRQFANAGTTILSLDLSSNGEFVAGGDKQGNIHVWNMKNGELLHTFLAHSGEVQSVVFSPDGQYIASGESLRTKNSIKLWSTQSGQLIRTFTDSSDDIQTIAFDRNNQYVATGTYYGVQLWDIATGHELIRIDEGSVSLAFSPNGNYLGNANDITSLWNIEDGKLLVQCVDFENGEWATIAPTNEFESSPVALSRLYWIEGMQTFGIERYKGQFYTQELLPKVLQRNFPEQQRVALIIGNHRYQEAPLSNPEYDANDMAEVLEKLGFEVFLQTDLNQQQMEEAVYNFTQTLESDDVALFYYSGHGVQVGGENYLIPIDERIRSAADVRYKAVSVSHILAQMEESGSRTNIMILDACRNNPFKGFKTQEIGFAPIIAPRGTFIAYATSPGSVAWEDGDARNSVYTKHLLRFVEQKGLMIEQQVLRAVEDETNKQQTPWIASSLRGDFYFTP